MIDGNDCAHRVWLTSPGGRLTCCSMCGIRKEDHAEITSLREKLRNAEAERDVWSGQMCNDAQAEGRGPCGCCRACFKQVKEEMEKKISDLHELLDWHDTGIKKLAAERDALQAKMEAVRLASIRVAGSAHEGCRACGARKPGPCYMDCWLSTPMGWERAKE